jgi:hypothetical protein
MVGLSRTRWLAWLWLIGRRIRGCRPGSRLVSLRRRSRRRCRRRPGRARRPGHSPGVAGDAEVLSAVGLLSPAGAGAAGRCRARPRSPRHRPHLHPPHRRRPHQRPSACCHKTADQHRWRYYTYLVATVARRSFRQRHDLPETASWTIMRLRKTAGTPAPICWDLADRSRGAGARGLRRGRPDP